MKKLLMLFCAAGLIATTSCSNGKVSKDDVKTPIDSLCYYMGISYGQGIREQVKAGPDSAKFNADEILKGIKVILDADTSNVSYEIGLNVGMQLRQAIMGSKAELDVDMNKDLLIKALTQALKSDSAIVSQENCQAIVSSIAGKIQAEKQQKEIAKNEAEGEEFLKKQMEADKSIKKTESGLAYKVIKEGTGAKLTEKDKAYVIYTGAFINGEKFDDSKGKALEFEVGKVVPGFTEALKMMAPGAHYIVYIPGKLGYGPNGQPYAHIGPNQMLVFDIQVVTAEEAKKLNEQPSAPVAPAAEVKK